MVSYVRLLLLKLSSNAKDFGLPVLQSTTTKKSVLPYQISVYNGDYDVKTESYEFFFVILASCKGFHTILSRLTSGFLCLVMVLEK